MEKLKAYNIRVYGKVQRVGFRRYVTALAQELDLTGHIENLPDGSVKIFIQGDEDKLREFLDKVKKPPLGKIKNVRIEEAHTKPELKGFKIIYGELADELQEGFGAMQEIFIQYWREFREFRGEFRGYRREFKDYRKEFREFTKRTDEAFKTILEKYGEISEKLIVILENLVKESRETREMLNETIKLLKLKTPKNIEA